MRPNVFLIAALIAFASVALAQTSEEKAGVAGNHSRQMLLVITEDWNAVEAVLQRYERAHTNKAWSAMGPAIAGVVGRNGLGWGIGSHETINGSPQKREGDGKSPAGMFTISSAFGFAPASEMTRLKLPYRHVSQTLECIDDPKSEHYNSLVDSRSITNRDWNSSEKMREIGDQYRLGLTVDHNTDPRRAGRGSCIFIHIWSGDGSGTSGCTAMSADNMAVLLSWLDAEAKPVLIQLPRSEVSRVRSAWDLPGISSTKTP